MKDKLDKVLYDFTTKEIKTPQGYSQSYIDQGSGDPMLMVHGNPTWSFFYRHLIKAFSSKYRTIAPDHIGCGLSDKPQDFEYTLDNHIKNLENIVLSEDLKNITLVVHDWGGATGVGLATRHPERFKRIVVLNTAAFRSQNIPKRIALCRIPLLGKIAVRGFNAFAGSATFMTTQKPLPDDVKRMYILPYDNWENRIATHEFVLDIPLEENHSSYQTLLAVEQGLEKLKHLPMQIIWGEHDWCFDLSFLEQWKGFFPEAKVNKIDAGHYLMEDKPEEVIELIEQFIKQN